MVQEGKSNEPKLHEETAGRIGFVPSCPGADTSDAEWIAACDQRLEELGKLEEGWNGYGAAAPNDLAISLAKSVLRRLAETGLPAPRVSPSAEEGICLSFRNANLYADIECFNSGEIVAATSDGRGQQNVWEADSGRQEITQTARRIGTHLNF